MTLLDNVRKMVLYMHYLAVKRAKEVGVPGALSLDSRAVAAVLLVRLYVDEVVGVIAHDPTDDEGSLPRGGELVLAGCPLDQPEHHVPLAKSERADLLAVVASQALLVDGRV